MTYEELTTYADAQARENELLTQRLYESEQEKIIIITNIKRALEVLGIPTDGSPVSKVKTLKSITSLATQAMISEDVIAKKFAFMEELMPLVEKYKEL